MERPESNPKDHFTDEMIEMLEAYLNGGLREKLGLTRTHLQTLLVRAQQLLQVGHHERALDACARIVLLDPGDISNLAGLANCAVTMGNAQLALRTANLMTMLEPRNPLGYYFSALACLGLGRTKEAEEDIRYAMAYAAEDGNARLLAVASRLASRFKLN